MGMAHIRLCTIRKRSSKVFIGYLLKCFVLFLKIVHCCDDAEMLRRDLRCKWYHFFLRNLISGPPNGEACLHDSVPT